MSYSTKAIILKPDSKGESRIHIRYTYNRKTNSISIREKIPAEFFDSAKGLAKPKYAEANDINIVIRQAQAEIEDIASGLENPEFSQVKFIYEKRVVDKTGERQKKKRIEKIDFIIDLTDAKQIAEQIAYHQEKLDELIKRQKELSLKGFGVASYEHNQILNMLEEFIKYHADKPVYAKQLKSFGVRFKKFTEKNNLVLNYDSFDKHFYNNFCEYLKTEHDATLNYIGSNITKLKALLTWIEDVKGMQLRKDYKKFKVLTEKKEVIFLTKEELDLLWDYKSECKKEYRKYIDLCIFGNATGLRTSDIKQSTFRIENELLKGRTVKTEGEYQIPLIFDERILEILKTYNFNMNLVSDQKYNKYIKEICKLVFEKHQINQEPIKIVRKKFAEKDKDEKTFYKYELLSSHSNRRGFCTRLWQDGYTERDILQIIGSSSSVILRGYIRNNEQDLLKKVNKKEKEKREKKEKVLSL